MPRQEIVQGEVYGWGEVGLSNAYDYPNPSYPFLVGSKANGENYLFATHGNHEFQLSVSIPSIVDIESVSPCFVSAVKQAVGNTANDVLLNLVAQWDANNQHFVLDHTFTEIYEAYKSGKIVRILIADFDTDGDLITPTLSRVAFNEGFVFDMGSQELVIPTPLSYDDYPTFYFPLEAYLSASIHDRIVFEDDDDTVLNKIRSAHENGQSVVANYVAFFESEDNFAESYAPMVGFGKSSPSQFMLIFMGLNDAGQGTPLSAVLTEGNAE